MARCELVLRNFAHPLTSPMAILAESALARRNYVHFLTTICIINAIIQVGNHISAAVAGGGETLGNDGLSKAVDDLKSALFPDLADELEKKAKAAKDTLLKEVNKGPIYVQSMASERKKGRIRLRST